MICDARNVTTSIDFGLRATYDLGVAKGRLRCSTGLTRQYIRDAGGKQIGVILPIDEYQALVRLQRKAMRRGRRRRVRRHTRNLCTAPCAIWAEQSRPPKNWMKLDASCGRFGIRAIHHDRRSPGHAHGYLAAPCRTRGCQPGRCKRSKRPLPNKCRSQSPPSRWWKPPTWKKRGAFPPVPSTVCWRFLIDRNHSLSRRQ